MNVTSYTHRVSPTWPPKNELNKDKGKHAGVVRERLVRPQPYTQNCRQLRSTERKAWSSSGKRCQMANINGQL